MLHPKVVIKETPETGKGLFATEGLMKGECVVDFEGPHYHKGDGLDYPYWTDDLEDHAVQIAEHVWVSNTGAGRYINHSCMPNCGIRNLSEVVAMRDIQPGEQLTYDYNMTEDSTWSMECHCGNPSCRRTIGAFKDMSADTRKKYNGYISAWLVEKYGLENSI